MTFGESATQEMCFFWTYYYPSQGSYLCVHSDQVAGGVNVFADVRREAVSVSNEMLLSRAPEAVIDLHYGASEPADRARAQKELAVWQTVSSVPAVRLKRVLPLYGDQFVVPGPRIAQAAEEMARALHPEAFK